jgi:predicted dithiol-disulfide oxidoreductase (DUF899 family)
MSAPQHAHPRSIAMGMPPIVSPHEWEAARKALLIEEKQLTRARDALAAKRRRMPRMAVEKDYRFEGPDGPGFDADFGVDEWHGTNAFVRDGERIFRTYFVNHRGDEALGSTWSYMDLTALGRQEDWEDSPEGYPQTRAYESWRRHDEYESAIDPWERRLDEKVAATKEHARVSAGDAK